MKKSILLFFCLMSTLMQAGNITGRIIDTKKNPLEFVNVALYDNNKLIKGTTSDLTGNFTFQNMKLGKYVIKFSYVGYENIELPIVLNTEHPHANLKNIILSENSKLLKEVQVQGQRSNMRLEVDRKVFGIDQAITAAGASASDALQNIPSVEVDTEGNISLRNNANVVVWINGRPSGLSEDNRAQILEQMPAESIESIEVITNPSAKFSPEGSAGIINIVLKKDRKAGYYGSVNGSANTQGGFGAGAAINYSSSKLDTYANLGYRSMNYKNHSQTNRQTWDDKDTTLLIQNNNGRMYGGGFQLRAGATYYATPKDQIGLSLFGTLSDRNNESKMLSKNALNLPPFRTRNSTSTSNNNMGEISLDYNHDFSKTQYLKLYAEYNYADRSSNSDYLQTNNTLKGESQTAQQQNDINYRSRIELSADYSNTFNENAKIEAGYKGNINQSHSNVTTFEGTTLNELISNPLLDNKFNYSESIHALYATYSGRINKFTYQAGLRGEYMTYSIESIAHENGQERITPSYYQLYPSLFLAYALPKNNELQLNYTRRVNRPRGRNINPFKNIKDSTNISFGNPNLTPEYSNSLELNYVKTWEAHTLSASAYYRNTTDVIQQITYMNDLNSMYSTFANITQSQSAGIELISKNKLFKILDLTTTLNLYQYQLDGFSYQYMLNGMPKSFDVKTTNSFTWDARIMANLLLGKGFTAQVSGRYRSPRVIAQGSSTANYSLDAGVRKTLFNRKLTLALTGRDLLNSHSHSSETWGDNFHQNTESYFGGRQIGLSVTYNFGNSNIARKKKRTEQNNVTNDVESEMMDF